MVRKAAQDRPQAPVSGMLGGELDATAPGVVSGFCNFTQLAGLRLTAEQTGYLYAQNQRMFSMKPVSPGRFC